MKKSKTIYIGLFILLFSLVIDSSVAGQIGGADIKTKLDLLRATNPQLDETVDISVSNLSIHEFLRGVAQNTGLNISVDNSLDFKVASNFKSVVVYDLLMFLCRQYNLDLNIQGNIIHVTKYIPAKEDKKDSLVKTVDFSKTDGLLSIDAKDVLLSELAKEVIQETGVNVIPDKKCRDLKVSGYVSKLKVDEALKTFCLANDLILTKDKNETYYISALQEEGKQPSANIEKSNQSKIKSGNLETLSGSYIYFSYEDEPMISISAKDESLSDIIKFVSDSLGVDYSLVDKLDEKITVNIFNQSYDNLIEKLLKGTTFCCKKEDEVYYFTTKADNNFNVDKKITLLNRTIENIKSKIPEVLKDGIEIVELPELNSLFLSGERNRVERLENFIKDIDQVIPVILIEVLIVNVSKTKSISTGINMGVGENPETSAQTLFPGVDYQLSTKTINNIFRKFESFGWVNLGKVTPEFYFAIKALEENGFVKIRSTPKLSALNGCKATLSNGETKYYKEEESNYIGTESPTLTSSYSWKPINADLSLSILPVVSGDDQVTLEIEVEQSEFTAREYEDAPPGSVTRTFKSSIRVKNQEMILLGGLDRLSSEETGSGVPLLSRIPVIKWLFSSKTKATSNSKLNVFIQPTILN